jgi:hypothetical protein
LLTKVVEVAVDPQLVEASWTPLCDRRRCTAGKSTQSIPRSLVEAGEKTVSVPGQPVALPLPGIDKRRKLGDRDALRYSQLFQSAMPHSPSIRSSAARQRGPKRPSTQCLMSQFPTHPNREFFGALQGIKSGDQGNFFPHQGIRSRPLFGFALTANAIVPTDLVFAEKAKRAPPDARSRRSRSRARSRFCPCEGAPGIPGNCPPSSSTRTNGVSGFAMAASVLSRAARRTQLHPSCGTE